MSIDVGVYLGGEGRNELGSRTGHPAHQTDDEPGVITALLRHVQPDGWTIVGATNWSKIRKLKAKGPTPAEERNVEALVLFAKEANASIVAFLRDADDDTERPKVISAAIARARADHPTIDVIGGCAIPVLEAWILAIQGELKTETLGKVGAQTRLLQTDFGTQGTQAMVDLIEKLDRSKLPKDAVSLHAWLRDADVLQVRAEAAKARKV